MKKLLLWSLTAFTFIGLQAQECENFAYLKQGAKMETTTYNKKDKLQSVSNMEVVSVGNAAAGGVEATLNVEVKDDKGKVMPASNFKMRCHNDVYYMDLTGLVPAESMAAMGSMEMTFSGDALEFPRNMSVGQSLPDATGSFKASTGGLSLMSMTFDYTDRKVEDKTNITTPAGTFDCYKISYTMNMKFMGKRSYKVVQYFNSEAGAVRTENYDQKGELESYTVLTKFSK